MSGSGKSWRSRAYGLAGRRAIPYAGADDPREAPPMPRTLFAALLLALPLTPALAQTAGLTLEQVERKYPRMSPVHIKKCDYDGSGTYTRTELLCVSGIYQQMYLDRN
jgi:hypothetical protein